MVDSTNLPEIDINAIVTDLNNKADRDLANLDSTRSSAIDGQWIVSDLTLESAATKTEGTYTYNLSNYLPNDNYQYEVIVRVSGHTGGTSGNSYECSLSTDIFTNEWAFPIVSAVTRTSASARANRMTNIVVGTGRYVKLKVTDNGIYNCYFTLSGYRRIGTNR